MKLGIAHTVNLEPLGARGSRHLRPVNNGTETSHMAKIQEDCVECCQNQTLKKKNLVQIVLHMKFQLEMLFSRMSAHVVIILSS